MTARVLVITGAGSGIGKEIARLAAGRGFVVVPLVFSDDEMDLLARIRAPLSPIKLDVTDASACEEVFRGVNSKVGEINAVIHCAGIFLRRSLQDTTVEDWGKILAVNLTGAFNVARAAIPWIGVGGSLTLVASHFAERKAHPCAAAYQASKAGVVGLVRALALEHAPSNIRVNGISPGPIDTPMTKVGLADPEISTQIVGSVPLGRSGTVSEVAHTALFLASAEASYITGQMIGVDGGSTLV